VDWVDDSKATNPHAAAASLAAYPRVVWIAGGLLKGADVDPLVAAVAPRLAGVVLLGRDRARYAASLARHAPSVPVVEVPSGDDVPMEDATGRGGTDVMHRVVAAAAGLEDGRVRVHLAVTGDGGKRWRAQILTPGLDGRDHNQHTPQVAFASGGRLDLAYYDLAVDGRQDVYLTSSTDDGRSFGAPRRLDDAPSTEDILFPAFADARLALLASDQGSAVAWPDTRRGTVDDGKSDVMFTTAISRKGRTAVGAFP
jgi:hypothetical protein